MQGVVGYFAGLGVWNWLILGVVLFVLEFMLPGVHFLWFGVAAVIVGILALATGITWPYQVTSRIATRASLRGRPPSMKLVTSISSNPVARRSMRGRSKKWTMKPPFSNIASPCEMPFP